MASELHSGLALGVGGHRGIDATAYTGITTLNVGGERCRKSEESLI